MGRGLCVATCSGADVLDCTPPAEVCNYRDEDCDGRIDEGGARRQVRLGLSGYVYAPRVFPTSTGFAALYSVPTPDAQQSVLNTFGPDGAPGTPMPMVSGGAASAHGFTVVLEARESAVHATVLRESDRVVVRPRRVFQESPSGTVSGLRVEQRGEHVRAVYERNGNLESFGFTIANNGDLRDLTAPVLVTALPTSDRFDLAVLPGGGFAVAYVVVVAGSQRTAMVTRFATPSATTSSSTMLRTSMVDDIAMKLAARPDGRLAVASVIGMFTGPAPSSRLEVELLDAQLTVVGHTSLADVAACDVSAAPGSDWQVPVLVRVPGGALLKQLDLTGEGEALTADVRALDERVIAYPRSVSVAVAADGREMVVVSTDSELFAMFDLCRD